ncbi:MAG: DDE-type integrase/transposase/recombinase [Sphingomonadales bacterium]
MAAYATKKRNKAVALRFLKKAMWRYGNPQIIVTDKLKSYGAAMREIGNQQGQKTGRHLNNSAENSHLPFRRREREIRRMRNLQKFAVMHPSLYNHFNGDRHLNSRPVFKVYRTEALSEWHQLAQTAA